MASDDFDRLLMASSSVQADILAYEEGYRRVMREMAWARAHGYAPTERQLVLALSQALRVYEVAHGGKAVGGRRPEWLRGRADALRELLRRGVGALPTDDEDEDND